MKDVSVTVYIDDDDGNETEYEVSATVTPGHPGSRHGDPGDWEPDEGPEISDIKIMLNNTEISEDDFEDLVGRRRYEQTLDELVTKAADMDEDDRAEHEARDEDDRDGARDEKDWD